MDSIYLAYNNFVDHKTAITSGCGASEFQISLLAKELAKKGLNVTCFNRGPIGKIDDVLYRSYDDIIYNKNIDTNTPLIFWRFFDVLPHLLNFYDPNKIIFWSHDYQGHNLSKNVGELINKNKIKVIAVSDFHKNSLTKYINSDNVSVIYNSLYSEFFVFDENIKVNKNSITFASAFHKGIEIILKLFDQLHYKYPNFHLNILSPNYGEIKIDLNKPYINFQESVGDKKILCKIIQSSLCLISTEFPETFGCIFAESYHLKTPVIATDKINGMHEFIDNNHTCNLKNYNEFENLLLSFYNNRPKVHLDEKFIDKKIVKIWMDLIKEKCI